MKILSDFDGVMTDQMEEALHERQLFRDKLAAFGALDSGGVDALIERADKELTENPTKHGWWSLGRVSAYADEDLFIRVIGLAVCMDQWAQADDSAAAPLLKAAEKAGFNKFEDVSSWAYNEMAAHTSAGGITPMDPIVGDVLTRLLDEGNDIVVVSNSATDRVVELLETLDLKPVKHSDDPNAQFRVRGDARKFELGEDANGFELNGFRFDVSRPKYQVILDGEVPDVVIGDVFSLDLALPLYLTRSRPEEFGGMKVLLRTREYSPEWSKAICTRTDEAHATMGLLNAFGDLPGILAS